MFANTTSLIVLCLFVTALSFAQSIQFCPVNIQSGNSYTLNISARIQDGIFSSEAFAAFGIPIFYNSNSLLLREVEYHTSVWDVTYGQQ